MEERNDTPKTHGSTMEGVSIEWPDTFILQPEKIKTLEELLAVFRFISIWVNLDKQDQKDPKVKMLIDKGIFKKENN